MYIKEEKVNWYKLRWNIEVYFKTLKSGFSVEKSRLRSLERIKKYVAFTSVLAWRIFWISKISRVDCEVNADHCFGKFLDSWDLKGNLIQLNHILHNNYFFTWQTI